MFRSLTEYTNEAEVCEELSASVTHVNPTFSVSLPVGMAEVH